MVLQLKDISKPKNFIKMVLELEDINSSTTNNQSMKISFSDMSYTERKKKQQQYQVNSWFPTTTLHSHPTQCIKNDDEHPYTTIKKKVL